MIEYIESFLNEANELVDKVESILFELEDSPENKDIIEEIFRHMHSIKGAAGMYGYNKTGNLTHNIENIFDQVRSGEKKINAHIIDTTFKAIDILRCLLKSEEKECNDKLEELLKNIHSETSGQAKEEIKATASESSCYLYYIFFFPKEDIYLRGINPANIIEELYSLGKYKEIIHDGGIPLAKQQETKKNTAKWELYLATGKPREDIDDVFMFIEDEDFVIGKIDTNNMETDDSFLNDIKQVGYTKDNFHFDVIKKFCTECCLENVEQSKGTNKNIKEEKKQESKVQLRKNSGKVSDKVKNLISDQAKIEKGVFVPSEKLDEMMNLVSELVTTNAELELVADIIKDSTLNDVYEKIHRLSKQFRDNALSIRLVPIKILYQQFKRLVRELSTQLGKEVEFIAEGLDTELDKTIIKALESPLLHILRNSIDHGIEFPEEREKNNKPRKGLLRLMSFYSGAQVIIQIHDDGAGINLDRVRTAAIKKGLIENNQAVSEEDLLDLIVKPGFSTANKVSIVSGRGVGMDVVCKEVAQVKGSLEINTEKGLGTIITLNIPITLSIIDTLLVTVDNYKFLLPVSDIEQCYTEKNSNIVLKEIRQVDYKDEKIPFINIRELFEFNTTPPDEHRSIIIHKDNQHFALLVDKIIGDHQAVLKPLGKVFSEQEFLSGGSILGDGSLAYILDTSKLLNYTHKKHKANIE